MTALLLSLFLNFSYAEQKSKDLKAYAATLSLDTTHCAIFVATGLTDASPKSMGTGVLIAKDRLLTAHHVVKDADRMSFPIAYCPSGRFYFLEVIRALPTHDLAIARLRNGQETGYVSLPQAPDNLKSPNYAKNCGIYSIGHRYSPQQLQRGYYKFDLQPPNCGSKTAIKLIEGSLQSGPRTDLVFTFHLVNKGDSGGGVICRHNGQWFVEGLIMGDAPLGFPCPPSYPQSIIISIGPHLEWIKSDL